MSYQPPTPKKSNTGLWLGGIAILLVALIAVVVLLLNRQPAPAAPASAVIVSAASATAEPAATPTSADTVTPVPIETSTPTSTPMPELGTSNLFIEYILDASGSMSETLSDGSPKIEVAQRVLTEHMRSFRPETNIGLRVYGHRLPYQQTDESCRDIELIAPPEKGQMERIATWLQAFRVQGMTPLAASLELAREDFIYDASHINSIVMLSDGIETCGGDPCQLVEDLKAQGINFTIHVIGLDVDDPTRQQLTCIAEAGGGTYHDARSQQELDTVLGAVKTDVTRGEVVVPPGVNTPTPLLPTSTLTQEPPTPIPALGIGSTMISEKDGMIMVYVPAGEFIMGSPDDKGFDNEHPQHSVYLDAFWIDKTEVTNAMYGRFVEQTGYKTTVEEIGSGWVPDPDNPGWLFTSGADWRHPTGPGSSVDGIEAHPVVQVSWSDATAYCQWTGKRLPTEAEWEKAARGTDGRIFSWGNVWDAGKVEMDGPGISFDVGSHSGDVSPYGALDMAGSAYEWVNDWYDSGYYISSPVENPQGPASGVNRVWRGGTWSPSMDWFRTALRGSNAPDYSDINIGFRCARSP